MKRLGFLGCSSAVPNAAAVALAGAMAVTVSTRAANAGCGDGACGRIDWTEVTASNQGTAVAAKLHGAFSWEASPDAWQTHPIGGTLSGYVWFSCVPPGDSGPVESTCTDQLATEMAKAGTNTPLTWAGVNNYDLTAKKPIVPKGLYAEGDTGAASYLVAFPLGGNPINKAVCQTALAFGKDGGTASGTGGATGGGPAGGQGGERDGGTHVGGTTGSGGTSGNAGGTTAAGGAPRSNGAGTGGASSDETGGDSSSSNGAADAGGGCRASGVAPHASGFQPWMAALAIAFASLRRSRNTRPRLL